MSLGSSLLAFAGGAAEAYNTDVTKKRDKERDALARAQELVLNSQLRVAETQMSKDLDRQEAAYKNEETIKRLGGRDNPDAMAWYAINHKGYDAGRVRKMFSAGERIDIPSFSDGDRKPFDYASTVADLLGAEHANNPRFMRGLNRQMQFRFGNGKDTGEFPVDPTAKEIQDKVNRFGTDDWETARSKYLEFTAPAPEVVKTISEKGIFTGTIGAGGEILSTDEERFTPVSEDLELKEGKDTYLGPNGKETRLLYSESTGERYLVTDKGPEKVNPDLYRFKPEGYTPSQVERDYTKMQGTLEKIRAGDDLDQKEMDEYSFLTGRYSTVVQGPLKEINGAMVQESFAVHPITQQMRNVTEFYKSGTSPVRMTKDQASVMATHLMPIIADAQKGGAGVTAAEAEVAKRFKNLHDAEKNLIYSATHALSSHYMETNQVATEGMAVVKAYNEISQYYNPESKSFNAIELHENIQNIVGRGQVDLAFMEEQDKKAAEDPTSVFARTWRRAKEAGKGTSRTSWNQFVQQKATK